jgi:hypothetical protein
VAHPVPFVAPKSKPQAETIDLKPIGKTTRQSGADTEPPRTSEKSGKDQKSRAKTPIIPVASAGSQKAAGTSGGASRKSFYAVVAGFILLSGGYIWTQIPGAKRVEPERKTEIPGEQRQFPDQKPQPPEQKPPEQDAEQPTKTDARREREARQREQQQKTDAEIKRAVDEEKRREALTSFKLQDNTTVSGQTIGGTISLTEADCAVACNLSRCDGWAFNKNGPFVRDGYRACLRFRAPLTVTANSDYVAGLRKPDPDDPRTVSNITIKPEVAAAKAEAASVTVAEAPAETDRVHCAGRYFVMPGFKLTCGQMLTGGTSPGPGPTTFIVGTANDCMAKCKPVENCVGFTYDAAEKSVQHMCRIFGPTPNTVNSAGWLRAVR